MGRRLWGIVCILVILSANFAFADEVLRFNAESGFLSVLDHTIQYAAAEDEFNYPDQGGQDRLFPLLRFSVDLELDQLHTFTFLYQPLEIESRVNTPAGLTIDGVSFSGDSLRVLYSFPFYRFSYTYRALSKPQWYLDAGISLQIRNAGIEFESLDGTGYVRKSDIGPVPLLKLRGRYTITPVYWVEVEADGIYAPVSYLNGSDNETVGALLDASLRSGLTLSEAFEGYINLRYLGGGASNSDPAAYTRNWLQFMTVSLGTTLTIR